MTVLFSCIECHPVLIRHSNETNRNMAYESQQNERDKQPSELSKIDA